MKMTTLALSQHVSVAGSHTHAANTQVSTPMLTELHLGSTGSPARLQRTLGHVRTEAGGTFPKHEDRCSVSANTSAEMLTF